MTDTTKYPSCEERIDGQLESAMEDIYNSQSGYHYTCESCNHDWYSDDSEYECPECESDDVSANDALEEYAEGVLSFDKMYTVYRLQLSWGGPQDEFRYFVNDGDVERIEYWFLDWWDGAHRELHGADFDAAERLFHWFYAE